MIKCPYCYTKNEVGTRFCSLCKSDIRNAELASESIVDVELVVDESAATEKALQKSNLNLPESYLINPTDNNNVATPKSSPQTQLKQDRLNNDSKLVVIRGQQKGLEYILNYGKNMIGRTDTRPVDIDLENQEDPKKVWVSRQHATILVDDSISIEDLNSSNGTYVNRERIFPGQKVTIKAGDIIQIGSVLLKLA